MKLFLPDVVFGELQPRDTDAVTASSDTLLLNLAFLKMLLEQVERTQANDCRGTHSILRSALNFETCTLYASLFVFPANYMELFFFQKP